MYVLALSELWHWTGDDDLLRRHVDTALRTFEWADRSGDLDGDGFLEYRRRARVGPKNQGWKDSDDAIRDADGRNVEAPIATVEEQAFHCIALLRMAEILVALDDDRPDAFLERAADLRRRWDEAFWMPDAGFYAMALGPDKGRSARSARTSVMRSGPGSCRPSARARSPTGCSPRTSSPAGAFARSRATIPRTTRSRTTSGRSGRSRTPRSRSG